MAGPLKHQTTTLSIPLFSPAAYVRTLTTATLLKLPNHKSRVHYVGQGLIAPHTSVEPKERTRTVAKACSRDAGI